MSFEIIALEMRRILRLAVQHRQFHHCLRSLFPRIRALIDVP
jgi:hypothetical protein